MATATTPKWCTLAEPANITPRSPYEPRWNDAERDLVRRYYGGQETFPAQPFPSAICRNCDEPIHAVSGGAGLWWVHGDGRADCLKEKVA